MENKCLERIQLIEDYKSQQTLEDGSSVIDLKKNDVVEFRHYGIYVIRKIDLGFYDGRRHDNFNNLKEVGVIV